MEIFPFFLQQESSFLKETTINEISENLNVNGYHIGHFNEFFNDLTGIKEEEFQYWSEVFRQTAIEKDKHYCYRHNFIAQNNPENYLKLLKSLRRTIDFILWN